MQCVEPTACHVQGTAMELLYEGVWYQAEIVNSRSLSVCLPACLPASQPASLVCLPASSRSLSLSLTALIATAGRAT